MEQNMITIRNLSKEFKGQNVLKNITMEIPKNCVYGLLGANGAGKSTLVRCINLLERPDSGSVFINDKDITALRGAELRRQRKKIGMIFQHFNLFASRTVLQNVIFPIRYNGLSAAEIGRASCRERV